jgi:DnaJ-domain-containing protein 1
MGRLEYDSSAFAYWIFSTLLAFLAPAAFLWRKDLLFILGGKGKQEYNEQIKRTEQQRGGAQYVKAARLEKYKQVYLKKTAAATTKVIIVGVGILFLILFFFTISGGGEQIAQFDPFEVLGISNGASDTEIKKAYRKLSLQWHPDRWSTADKEQQSVAEARFVRVARAYAALTDEIAKENYKKYGNPDGRQALEMSIGLPEFLLDPSTQFYVVGCYLILILIILPSIVLLWTKENTTTTISNITKVDRNKIYEQFGPENIDPDTQEIFRVMVKRNVAFPIAIDIFATSAEFRALEYDTEEEKEILQALKTKLSSKRLMPQEINFIAKQLGCFHDGNEIACILTYAHLSRETSTLTPGLIAHLEYVLFHAFPLLHLMIAHARTTCFMPTLVTTIRLLQCFTQAIGPESSPFWQAPGLQSLTEAEELWKAVKSKCKADSNLFHECLNLSVEKDFPSNLQPQATLLKDFVHRTPFRRVTAKIGTTKNVIKPSNKDDDVRTHTYEWEPFSVHGDMIRVVATAELVNPNMTSAPLVSANIDNGFTSARAASAPFIPFDVTEQWFFILTNGPSPKGMHNIPSGEAKVVAFQMVSTELHIYTLVFFSFLCSVYWG